MDERHEVARKVIKILIKNKIVPIASFEEEYLKVWDAALEVVDELIDTNKQ